MSKSARSICTGCGKKRESLDEDWFRVAKSGKGGTPGTGGYIGTVGQYCASCWPPGAKKGAQ